MDKKTDAVVAAKRAAGYMAAEMVKDGMVVGLGTGSTVMFTIEHLAGQVENGLKIFGIPTSFQTAIRARQAKIPLTTLDDHPVIDIAIDGADEVNQKLQLIKGRGAAHLREKCVATAARRFIVVVDEAKVVNALSAPVPIEVLPFAVTPVMHGLRELNGNPILREGVKKDGPVITDNGNFVVDCTFREIRNPEKLESAIAAIPGVIESGLFCGFAQKTTVIVGSDKKCKVMSLPDIVA